MFDEIFAVSSLEKVFSDTKPMPYSGRLSMLRKDRLSFQAAFQFLGDRPDHPRPLPRPAPAPE